ncbi:MAG TPA: hypothetical protein VMV79_08510, partial [Alphaproteobacteria bacterium]|nr:hypothetical protein [Alphaproteobacteria bacterium]
GLRRLVTTSVFTLGPTYATGMHMPDHLSMGSKVLHFEVPPGVHVYRSEVPSSSSFLRNGRIQYIKMHLHPYGQSVELYDETARKTVWKGMARNVPGRDVLAWTDHYGGGGDGLQIYKDHKYQVITTYDNTTRKPVDAMGNLRVYFEGTRPVSAIRQAPHD